MLPLTLTTLLTTLSLTSAFLTTSPQNSTNVNIGFLYARDASNTTYHIAGTPPDPANLSGAQPIVGLTPYVDLSHNEFKLDYSLQGQGLVRAGSDFGGQLFWIVKANEDGTGFETRVLNTTSDDGGVSATPGFTFNVTGDETLGFAGEGFGGFYGCTGLQVNGALVLEMEFDGVVPSDGSCKRLTVGKFAGLP